MNVGRRIAATWVFFGTSAVLVCLFAPVIESSAQHRLLAGVRLVRAVRREH